MGQIYYDFPQGLNFIDPNGFNTTIFWDEIKIRIKETNLIEDLMAIYIYIYIYIYSMDP